VKALLDDYNAVMARWSEPDADYDAIVDDTDLHSGWERKVLPLWRKKEPSIDFFLSKRVALPLFFERAPFFRDEEPEAPPPPPALEPAPPRPPAPVRPPAPAHQPAPPPAPTPVASTAIALPEQYDDVAGPSYELDFNPAATATHIDAHVEPEIATRSFELEGDEIATAVEEHHADAAGPSFELEVGTQERYAQCNFENGKWTVTHTTVPKQPRDGFTIVDPGDQREIDQFCRTYEYADPDTRRMIRVSCELMIAQPRGR